MILCGGCGDGITAEEKFKKRGDGSIKKYVYYHCSRFDYTCKQPYVREDELLSQILQIIDKVDFNKLGIQKKLEIETQRLQKFSLGILQQNQKIVVPKVDTRTYAKYLLQEGTREEKRELLSCPKSKLKFIDGKLLISD